MKIARPPIKLMCLAYLIANLVPKVPIKSQQTTQIKLNPPNMNGSTCAVAPCADNIKFSILPKINNHINCLNSFAIF